MYKRILVYFIMILFLCVSILSFKTYSYTKDEYYNHVEKSLTDGANIIISNITSYDDFIQLPSKKNILQFSNITDSRLTIISTEGEVIFESNADREKLENHAQRPEIKNALMGDISVNIRYSTTVGEDMMYVAVPIIIDDIVIGVVRNSVSLDTLRAMTNRITRDIITTLIITLSISIIAFYLLINGIIKPLGQTTRFAKDIANGNYGKRLSMIRDDEIGSLSSSLNHMATQLESSFNQLSQRNIELESVLSSIKNGIIAINKLDEIILINNTALNMLNLPKNKDLIGKNILEAIRTHELYKSITELQSSQNINQRFLETQIEEHIYSIYTKPIVENSSSGLLIVIEDITQIRKLENIRKDFVANVTHELKTPITSIKGFIETLISGDVVDPDTRNKFYNIIENESDRLIRLVEDILTLSSLDSQAKINYYEVEKINVKAQMDDIYALMKKNALDKNVELLLTIADDVDTIQFNSNYFKQMMINLIDNAIKYNKISGCVEVKINSKDNNVIIEVIDNGVGMHDKDLHRIFERFYRIDKGRARQAGGTGLGLAIVKHIVQIQGCEIKVESKLNKGTKFTITIPVKQ
ncbi:HAMP domain-containing protein [Alkalibaculum sp. M08DMB]|uniref:histidine kinase n=1 Tax=Alkalibaculum sporogenes TaxID=2655001 RepID=A0A6A7K998_9FIRM|nr:ATP-binding protein [Alkalibaculum sporogenes]MPW26004.1 HAMP domain-containing protein [Alkalibaculum sporogenes]